MKMPPAPFKKIGSIWLPSGVMFDVWSNYAIAVPKGQLVCSDMDDFKITQDDVCCRAAPRLPTAYFKLVRPMFEQAGLLAANQILHWVGHQTSIQRVCTCFGILERE